MSDFVTCTKEFAVAARRLDLRAVFSSHGCCEILCSHRDREQLNQSSEYRHRGHRDDAGRHDRPELRAPTANDLNYDDDDCDAQAFE